ncbi:MAG: hypothetical protein V3V51_09200 [Desulfobacterales bacterium]|jgi:hypothetical protein
MKIDLEKLYPPRVVRSVLDMEQSAYSQYFKRGQIESTAPATGRGTVAGHGLVNICQIGHFLDLSKAGIKNELCYELAFNEKTETVFKEIINRKIVKNPPQFPLRCAAYIQDPEGGMPDVQYFDSPISRHVMLIPIVQNQKSIFINFNELCLSILEKIKDKDE